MAILLARKIIPCESRLHFKCKNDNIEKTLFWVRRISMEGHTKAEFHIFI